MYIYLLTYSTYFRISSREGSECCMPAKHWVTCRIQYTMKSSTKSSIVKLFLMFNRKHSQELLFTFLPREATRSAVLPRQVVLPSVCPSVCLSVTFRYRGHIGWNSLKVISRLISPTFSLPADLNMTDLFQREHPKF